MLLINRNGHYIIKDTKKQDNNMYNRIFVFLIVACIFAGSKCYAQDYLNELYSANPIIKNPIKIWVQPHQYSNIVYQSFEEWTRAAGGCLSFKYTSNEKIATIKVYFTNSFQSSKTAGVTRLHSVPNKYTQGATIYISLINPLTKKPFNTNTLRKIATHEIGHALGINGHSSNRNDIMYPDTSIIGFYTSNRDYATIRRMYCK